MATRRRGAYSSSMLTLAVFLTPALMAPGPVEMANVAGIALAIWFAVDAGRVYGRTDLPATLPYRISPVAPSLLGSAALIFALALLHGWTVARGRASPLIDQIDQTLSTVWNFPFSPVGLFAKQAANLPSMSDATIRSVTFCLSAAVALGLLFGLFALIGAIWNRGDLRQHALIWKGVKITGAADALAARGAKGLRPMRDPLRGALRTPVSGRLFLRSLSLLVAIFFLPFAPLFLRLAAGSRIPAVEKIFASDLATNAFFSIWLVGLWAMLVAAAIILFFAYLRLAFILRLRR